MPTTPFTESTKMADVVLANVRMLYVLPYFGIELGFGEKTIEQICVERKISRPLFLFACNFYAFDDYVADNAEIGSIPLDELLVFLDKCHRYFIDTRLPIIVGSVMEMVSKSPDGEWDVVGKFVNKYYMQIVDHLRYEDEVLFPHIRKRLKGEHSDLRLDGYGPYHSDVGTVLEDLKNIIIKYMPLDCTVEECRPMLQELFAGDYGLRKHAHIEDTVLMPLLEHLESGRSDIHDGTELSAREKDTLKLLAQGLQSKQIADELCISLHTVNSHRKNIMRKTGLKSAQGLALYALSIGLISGTDHLAGLGSLSNGRR